MGLCNFVSPFHNLKMEDKACGNCLLHWIECASYINLEIISYELVLFSFPLCVLFAFPHSCEGTGMSFRNIEHPNKRLASFFVNRPWTVFFFFW